MANDPSRGLDKVKIKVSVTPLFIRGASDYSIGKRPTNPDQPDQPLFHTGCQAAHSWMMSDGMNEQLGSIPKATEWAERITAQQRSGISVKQFCKEQGLTEYSFYAWRKRLQKKEPVRFALVDSRREQFQPPPSSPVATCVARCSSNWPAEEGGILAN
ncbi:MAG TPA: hypothetical protein VGH38_37245 [Bryobacteraceae bacterium]